MVLVPFGFTRRQQMTTGNISTGSRYLTSLGMEAGTWKTKIWSGTDRPKGARPGSPEYSAPHYYQCSVMEKSIPEIRIMNDRNYPYPPRDWESVHPGHTSQSLFGLPSFPADPWTSNDDLALIAKLREKVNSGRANVAVTIAEMGETIDTIGSLARRVAKLTEDAAAKVADVRGKVRSPRHFAKIAKAIGRRALRKQLLSNPLKRAANGWLEYRLAVYPALMDIRNHCESLANLQNKKNTTRFTAGRISRDVKLSPNAPPVMWGPATTAHKCYIRAILKDEPNRLLSYTGLADPASVLWEKIPFSWVVDWMLPVGDFLAAVDFWRRNEGVFVVTHVQEWTCVGCHPVLPSNGQYSQTYEPQSGFSYRYFKMERKVNTELPIPYPSLDVAVGKSLTSLKRTLDAVSLFTNRFR